MNVQNIRLSHARGLTALLLLWLAGTGLHLTILAVPLVIPLIHDALNLSATAIGILTDLPSMLFAAACGILLVILAPAINHGRPVGS